MAHLGPNAVMLYTMGPNHQPPELLSIDFDRRRVFNDTALARVLEDHPSIDNVSLHGLGSLWAEDNDATLPAFRQKLETLANLRCVMITGGSTHQAPPSFTSPFLRSLTGNPSLSTVGLVRLRIYTEDLTSLLPAVRSAPMSLWLSNLVVESPRIGKQNAIRGLTEAMKSSKSIRSLRMSGLQGDAAQAILTGLSTNQSVETLGLSWDMLVAAEESSAQSVHNILENTTKIKRFILPDVQSLTDAGHDEISNRIATDLIKSVCVTEIEFGGYGLRGAALRTFQSILREKTNLRSLRLPVGYLYLSGPSEKTLLTELLRRPESPLRTLSLLGPPLLGDPEATFTPFLVAVAQSRVEVLDLSCFIDGRDGLLYSALIRQVPALRKLRELRFNESNSFNALLQMDFLRAVKENFSLQKVSAEPLLNPQNKQQLDEYLTRNKRLANFAKKPASVGREVWPDALAMAGNAPGTLFLASKSVLPELAENASKRLKPQHPICPTDKEVSQGFCCGIQ